MLEILLVWCYLFLTSYAAGAALIRFAARQAAFPKPVHPALVSLCGLVAITVVAGYLSLLFPTGAAINAVLAAGTLVYFIQQRPRLSVSLRGRSVPACVALACFFFLALTRSAGDITTMDSAGYHLPYIQWLEDFSLVPGLANVHSRFGFNYQYHILAAAYGLRFLGLPTVHALNGYLMVLSGLLLVPTRREAYARPTLSLRVAVLAFLFVLNMTSGASSFSPDFPVTAMVIACLLLTIGKAEEGSLYRPDYRSVLVFVLSVGAVLFKLSAVPVVLLNLFLWPAFRRRPVLVLILGAVVAGCFVPYFVRSYVTTGYLVYPLYRLDLFHPDWKLPLYKVVLEKDMIRTYALGLPAGSKLPLAATLSSWWHYLRSVNPVYPLMIAALGGAVGLSAVLLAAPAVYRNKYPRGQLAWLFALLLACLAYWWGNAPDPRFGNGFIIAYIGLTAALLAERFAELRTAMLSALWIAALFSAYLLMGKNISQSSLNYAYRGADAIWQKPYPEVSGKVYSDGEGHLRYRPVDPQFCWDTRRLPCAYREDFYRYRGARLQDGFRPGTPSHKWFEKTTFVGLKKH